MASTLTGAGNRTPKLERERIRWGITSILCAKSGEAEKWQAQVKINTGNVMRVSPAWQCKVHVSCEAAIAASTVANGHQIITVCR
nr:hypothetical protein CFP56_33472 [Quercus suber]